MKKILIPNTITIVKAEEAPSTDGTGGSLVARENQIYTDTVTIGDDFWLWFYSSEPQTDVKIVARLANLREINYEAVLATGPVLRVVSQSGPEAVLHEGQGYFT